MPDTWIDEALGAELEPDERFAARLEASLRDEWRNEPPVVALSSTDSERAQDGSAPGRRRRPLLVAAAVLLAVGGVVTWQVTADEDEPAPATTPDVATSVPPTTPPAGEVTFVAAEGGESLSIDNEAVLASYGGGPLFAVTAWSNDFAVLDELAGGRSEVRWVPIDSSISAGWSAPIERPRQQHSSFTIHVDRLGTIYATWLTGDDPVEARHMGAARYTQDRQGYHMADAATISIEDSSDPDVSIDDRGLVIDGAVVLEDPGRPDVAVPTVRVLDEAGNEWTAPGPEYERRPQRRPDERITVEWSASDGAARSWKLRLQSPADGVPISTIDTYPIPGTGDVVVLEGYLQQGELRTNVIRLHEDGTASIGFVRGWLIASLDLFDRERLMIWEHLPDGVALATADVPA